jgi:hypothetical protein
MFARDKAMKAFIDDWLGARIASGAWRRMLNRAMTAHSAGPG